MRCFCCRKTKHYLLGIVLLNQNTFNIGETVKAEDLVLLRYMAHIW